MLGKSRIDCQLFFTQFLERQPVKFTPMLRSCAAVVLAVLAQIAAVPASIAGTASGSLLVSATVLSTCAVATTPVSFGNYTAVQLDTTGSITVTCTADVLSYNIGIGAGSGISSTTSNRKMTSVSTSTLNYEIFGDSGRTVNWGNIPGIDTLASTANTAGTGAVKTFTAYARLPAGQISSASTYTDALLVTVNF
jgi:spore coat protein U-like protein